MLKILLGLLAISSLAYCGTNSDEDWMSEDGDWVPYYEKLFKEKRPMFNCNRNTTGFWSIQPHVRAARYVDVPRRKQRVCDMVLPGLYLGGKESIKYCIEHKLVDRIISFNSKGKRMIPKHFKGNVITLYKRDNKHTDIGKIFKEVYPFMLGAKKGLLVHCTAGHSRSPSICILYIMDRFDVSYEDSLHYVRTMRPSIGPNKWFVRQLKEIDFHRRLYKTDTPN